MRKSKFPASLPRKMYWSDEVGGCSVCPGCDGRLEPESHSYLMGTRHAGKVDLFMVGNSGGHFCGGCPIVVLDRDEFERFAAVALPGTRGADFMVMGIVDLDAVPEDKRHVPFGEDTNPIPLVKFINLKKRDDSRASGSNVKSNKNRMKRERRKIRKTRR